LRAFHQRIAVRRGGNIATVAVARKLAVIAWPMLSRGEDYAFSRPSLTREKPRRLELMTGAKHKKGKRIGVFAAKQQHRLDKELAAQAELAYRRLVRDWHPAIKGTGGAPGRASRRPSSGQAARQETAPPPAL
jgi:transposase